MEIQEGRIKISVPDNCSAIRFDADGLDGTGHGLSHCMKAVDFIIETPNALNLIELKDPDRGPQTAQDKWLREWNSNKIESDLLEKFRDTWLYLHASKRINKKINYLVIVQFSQLSTEVLSRFSDKLKANIPAYGPNGAWSNPLIDGCQVFNVEMWNAAFGEKLPAEIVGLA